MYCIKSKGKQEFFPGLSLKGFFIISVLFVVFLSMSPVMAQTDGSDNIDVVEISEEADEDEEVRNEDLGIESDVEAKGAFGRFFRNIRHGVTEAITFDSAKKAELKLEHANEVLIDATLLTDFEKAGDEIVKFEAKLEGIDIEKLRKAKGEGNRQVDNFLDKILDNQIKHQKVLDNFEKKVLRDAPKDVAKRAFDRVKNVQERSAARAGDVLTRVETNQDNIAERFDRVLENQRGSEFKDIKNLEILKRVEQHVSEDAREGIRHAQDNAFKRVTNNLKRKSGDVGEDFENYIKNIDGDQTQFIEVIDGLKSGSLESGLSLQIIKKLERFKDISATRFQHEIENFGENFDEDFQRREHGRSLQRFKNEGNGGPDVGQLRVIEEIRQRVHFEDEKLQAEIEEHHKASILKFKEAFSGDTNAVGQAARFEKLSRSMAENPDPTTFRLLQELEKEVRSDPKKAKFLEQIDREAKQKFAENAKENGDEFFEHIVSTNPQDIEIFKQLKRDFAINPGEFFGPEGFDDFGFGEEGFILPEGESFRPPGFAVFFDRAINKQTEGIQDHLEQISNPEFFEQFQQKFDKFDFVPSEFLQFQDGFKDKRKFFEKLEQDKFDSNRESGGERQKIEEEFRSRFEDSNLTEEERKKLEEQFRGLQIEQDEKDFKQRQEFFEQRLELDPFCDERCRVEEKKRFQGNLDRQRNEIFEFDTLREEEGDFQQFRDDSSFNLIDINPRFQEGEVPSGLTAEEFERKKIEGRDRFEEEFRFEEKFENNKNEFRQEIRFDNGEDEFRFENRKEFDREEFDRPPPVDEKFFKEGQEKFRDDFNFEKEFNRPPEPEQHFDREPEPQFDRNEGNDFQPPSQQDFQGQEQQNFDEQQKDFGRPPGGDFYIQRSGILRGAVVDILDLSNILSSIRDGFSNSVQAANGFFLR